MARDVGWWVMRGGGKRRGVVLGDMGWWWAKRGVIGLSGRRGVLVDDVRWWWENAGCLRAPSSGGGSRGMVVSGGGVTDCQSGGAAEFLRAVAQIHDKYFHHGYDSMRLGGSWMNRERGRKKTT